MNSTARTCLLVLICLYLISTQISMAAMNIAAGIALLGSLAALPLKKTALKSAFPSRWMIGMGVTVLGCVAMAGAFPIAWAYPLSWPERIAPLTKCWYGIWAYVLFRVFIEFDAEGRRTMALSYFATVPVFGIVGIQQFWSGWPRAQPIPGFDGHFHVILWQGHHLSVASIFIFPVFLLAGAWLKRNPILNKHRAFWGLSVGIGVVALFCTWSRILWVALLPGTAVLLYLTLTKRWATAVSAAALVAGLVMIRLPFVAQRLETALGTHDRYVLWRLNWSWFLERSFFGVGFLQSGRMSHLYFDTVVPIKDAFRSHAHNNLLEMLAGVGIVGTGAWAAWNFKWLTDLYASARLPTVATEPENAGISEGLLAALVTFHVNGITQVNFWEGKVMHSLAVAYALTYAIRARQNQARLN